MRDSFYFIDTRWNLANVDENQLFFRERIGLAYCRMCHGQWDDFLGPDPECHKSFSVAYSVLLEILGESECSRYWWKFALGRNEEEWLRWYIQDRIMRNRKDAASNSIMARIKRLLRSWRLWR